MTFKKRGSSVLLSAIMLVALALHAAWPAYGQGDPEGEAPQAVVTTQDYSSLRAGPGIHFPRTAIVDPAVTLAAVGRSADTRWVQVEYQGQLGWIHAGLLVWVGDIVSLPVDGIYMGPFVRRVGVGGITTRETPLYSREITPSDQVGTLPAGTPVEITGRLGEADMYQVQILYEDRLYWVGSWNVRIIEGDVGRVLDTSYLYAYGRLLIQLENDIRRSGHSLDTIEAIWQRLGAGERINCRQTFTFVTTSTASTDLAREPIFAPLVAALESGNQHTNRAISAFEDACDRAETNPDYFLTEQEVNVARNDLDTARQNLNVARSLYASLDLRNPILSSDP